MGKNRIFAIVFGLVLVAAATAQNRLVVSSSSPEIDGVIVAGEYSLMIELPRGTLYLNRTEQVLSIAIQSELDGWVGVGLGSQRMNQASIYIGYVDSGREVFARQQGRGHSHRDASVAEPAEVRLGENAAGTVMELSFPASAFVPSGSSRLSLIVACGKRNNLTSYHSMRRGLEIEL
ncbi:MAG: hypothetical protein JSV89_10855 [Spirochaetaceae bacterium]|nr:MAG: hypothetical protein JSV89_10855 [Spirochaetaceae bacterium]